jgi:hypothetical protein
MPFSLKLPRSSGAERADAMRDSIAEKPVHWRRENFIPVRKAELSALLASQPGLSPHERAAFEQLARLLSATCHHEFQLRLEELKNAYAVFDPDADTEPATPITPAERDARAAELFEKFVWLLERANFVRLTKDDIHAALGATSDWGLRLNVNLDIFERLEVFARGDVVGRRTRRRWRNFYRLEVADVPIYQRLVVIFRLHRHETVDGHVNYETIQIKNFKNIPKMDLEMLLPGTRVKMSLIDQSKIFFPTVSGVAITGVKLFQGALVVAVSGMYGMLTFLGLVAGTFGYAVKSFFGYLRTQQKYQLSLTRSLYYQNLDNNAGVLFRLLDEAEEQECRESLLAYFFLWRRAGADSWPAERLDGVIEAFLRDTTGVSVDFEVSDAVDKLRRMGLVETTAEGCLRAVPIERGLVLLDQAWDNLFRVEPAERPNSTAASRPPPDAKLSGPRMPAASAVPGS